MKKQKNLKQHIGLLLAAGLLFAGTTVSAAENEPEQPECMTTEQVEELNLCNTLDEQEPLTVEEATRTYQAGNTVVSFLGEALGPDYEVVLHDLTSEDGTIVAIVNNHISGRTEGAPLYFRLPEKEGVQYAPDFVLMAENHYLCR